MSGIPVPYGYASVWDCWRTHTGRNRKPERQFDTAPRLRYTYNIMAKEPTPLTDALRRAIIESKLPYLTIEQGSGVMRQCIMRFAKGRTTLQLDTADKLAAYFGIECKQRKTKRKG